MSPGPAGYVVVGGGVSAARAVETLRDEGYDGTLTVLAAEPRLPYDRPPLSKQVLKGDDKPDSVYFHDEAWYSDRQVEVRSTSRATG
jgi:3-phenylpropionate/trans-cinnamate dioxygenase ferredoxin reductase component